MASPVVSAVVPAAASTIDADDPVQFNVTDADNNLLVVFIYALHDSGAFNELVFDGSAFLAPFSSSTRTPIANGHTYVLLHTVSGWPDADLTIRIIAADATGNLVITNIAYTVDNPDSVVAPVVSNYSPTVGTEIDRTDPLFFDVTDDSGDFRRVLISVSFPDDSAELAHNGDSFTGLYIVHSEREPITGGWHYRLRRTGGWPDQPTVTAYAFDKAGHENS